MKIMEKFAQKQRELANYPGVALAFLGDSVTQGCFETHRRAVDELRTRYDQEKGYHHQLARMLATLYPLVPVNLINAGILPLTFHNPDDYDRIGEGLNLELKNINSGMESGTIIGIIRETGEEIRLSCSFTQRQTGILKAGGLLNYTKECNV